MWNSRALFYQFFPSQPESQAPPAKRPKVSRRTQQEKAKQEREAALQAVDEAIMELESLEDAGEIEDAKKVVRDAVNYAWTHGFMERAEAKPRLEKYKAAPPKPKPAPAPKPALPIGEEIKKLRQDINDAAAEFNYEYMGDQMEKMAVDHSSKMARFLYLLKKMNK